jgi:hypothetical protein
MPQVDQVTDHGQTEHYVFERCWGTERLEHAKTPVRFLGLRYYAGTLPGRNRTTSMLPLPPPSGGDIGLFHLDMNITASFQNAFYFA